jgi:N-ethylmaleimide reductase
MNMSKNQPLLKEIVIGDLKLSNRIVMAPMTRSRANNSENRPTELHAEYYGQRASAGLIITCGSQVSKRAVGYINTPGIYSEPQIQGWKLVTEEVHKKSGKIFIQLWHVGRISHPDFHNGEPPLAPSALNPKSKSFTYEGFKDTVTPKAMSINDINQTIKDFKNAASNAMKAGFDGVEIHSSNGYLFHQFFTKSSNTRTDEYGGSIENRARFLFKVIEAVKEEIPENRIGARLNPSWHNMSGIMIDEETIPTFEYIVKKLNNYNLAYLHLSEPFTDVTNVRFAKSNIAEHFRPLYKGNLIINYGFNQEKGNKVIQDGLADLVAFGKLFISNPDLPKRFELNAQIAPWNEATFYTPGEKGYIDYPFLT